jgi:hypothetical protein
MLYDWLPKIADPNEDSLSTWHDIFTHKLGTVIFGCFMIRHVGWTIMELIYFKVV